MIDNWICPYCATEMVRAENLPNARSAEHMIPNKLLSTPRTPKDADFYACRACNSRKSNLDHVLAVLARAQSHNPELATDALADATTKKKGSARRFIEMVNGREFRADGVHMTVPVNGRGLFDYIMYFAKGQYFQRHGELFDEHKQVAIVSSDGKQVFGSLEREYRRANGSRAAVDLAQNPLSESLGDGEAVLWSRELDYLFVLHRYIGIGVKIRRRSRSTYREAREHEHEILRDFNWRG